MSKKIIAPFISIFIIAVGLILIAGSIIVDSSSSKLYSSVSKIPSNRVGLVLGCSKYLSNGRFNMFFQNRISAAAYLYKNHKIDYIIVSGDNSKIGYNEPADMKQSLIELGVPAEHVYCDYAGFRTLDSVVRAKEIFNCDSITIISQEFHNERAVFIADHYGINAVGFNAEEVSAYSGFKTKLREHIAKAFTILDLYVFGTGPKFYGPKVKIGKAI